MESFKYILLKGDESGNNFTETGINGNFTTFQVGSNTISNTVSVDGNTTNIFKFIVYIDGSMYNNPNMMESSMNSSLVIGDCDSVGTVIQRLNSVEPGSYVAYTGANGCPDGHCDGTNANYVSDTDMGYCNSSSYKFSVNGWRVGYIQNDTAYLVSAGAPECLATYIDSRSSSTSTQTLSTDYYYGSGYTFDSNTGNFSLTGVTSSTLAWSSNYESIIANTPYTCKKTSSTATCTTLYEVTAYSSSTEGVTYPHYNNERTVGAPQHLANLDSKALTYCNPSYAFGGACDSNSAWAMDAIDFEAITGTPLYYNSCYYVSDSTECGYGNDLIDNGGYYWYATAFDSSSTHAFSWYPNRPLRRQLLL